MSVAATKVEFDSDGLPIPKGYNVPAKTVNKSTIQFDGDGLPIPQKKKRWREWVTAFTKFIFPYKITITKR